MNKKRKILITSLLSGVVLLGAMTTFAVSCSQTEIKFSNPQVYFYENSNTYYITFNYKKLKEKSKELVKKTKYTLNLVSSSDANKTLKFENLQLKIDETKKQIIFVANLEENQGYEPSSISSSNKKVFKEFNLSKSKKVITNTNSTEELSDELKSKLDNSLNSIDSWKSLVNQIKDEFN